MRLNKNLKLIDIFCISSGAMISSGIFVLPGIAYNQTGPSVFASYMLAAVLATFGMLSQAELVSAMPKAGGTYFFVSRSLGPAVGTINGILTWFSLALKTSFALIGLGTFISLILPVEVNIIALILALFFVVLNLIGVKEASRFQITIVVVLITLMCFYVVYGIPRVRINNFEDFAPHGFVKVLTTSGFVFVSYGGLIGITSVAEEVENPGRNIPMGMMLSILVVSILYVLSIIVTVGVLDSKVLSTTLVPISDGGRAIAGKTGWIIMTVGAVLAFSSTANAGIMSASRLPLALGRDMLVPKFLGKVSVRFKTPIISILITACFIISVLFLKLEVLVKAASTVIIFSNIFSSLSVIIMRESKLQNYRPQFKAPLYPWIQIVGIIGFLLLLIEMGMEAIMISIGLSLVALAMYFFYGRYKTKRDYALLYLIRRITARELQTGNLEEELKNIVFQRDEVVKDRFDKLIEESPVIDLDSHTTMERVFRIAAEIISSRVGLGPEIIFKKLMARESESSTVINEFVAIPHIVIEGSGIFNIVIIRSKKGIFFNSKYKKVKAVFVLLGSKDERNFHLKCLSAIAQAVHNVDFEKRWLEARDEQGIRDVIILSNRRRFTS